jgi:hypothetical protein
MSRREKTRRVSAKTEQSGSGLSERTVELLCVGAILILACALILANLGNIYMWQDEAQTSLIAKTILSHGVPLGTDGRNSFSQDGGLDLGKNGLWIWQPWFALYLLAGFFAAFGASAFTARLPFALIGIGTVVFTYYLGKALWASRRIAVLAAVLLLLCVPFLILIRTCKYSSAVILFSVAGLYSYVLLLRGRRLGPAAFVLSSLLLFHTHYLYSASMIATALLHAILFRRDRLRPVLAASALALALSIPWIILFSRMGRIAMEYIQTTNRLGFAGFYVTQVAKHIAPPALLALLGGVYLFDRSRTKGAASAEGDSLYGRELLGLFIVVTLGAISLASQSTFFRYLCAVIPAFMLLMALGIDSLMRIHRALGLALLVVLACWWRMPDYLYEITHDFDGPIEGIVLYLGKNARPTDVVVTNHEDMPIKFYTNLRVISGISGEDYKPGKDADWVIKRKYVGNEREQAITRYLAENVPWEKYEAISLSYPDTPHENRESPEEHMFKTAKDEELVVIWHRVRK